MWIMTRKGEVYFQTLLDKIVDGFLSGEFERPSAVNRKILLTLESIKETGMPRDDILSDWVAFLERKGLIREV